MVWSTERQAELPPLSAILPWLYLGAESDVTQDRLASLGISYVLSVSRCSPQPSFLPRSKYLRIPIDDSLREDLLPWIPQALHFIDAAMSSGASVLVHCAAGISRSPALAVAYIMYSLGMDLDQAYRFVKERRPSISPNFNFLGQLQFFQGTLTQKAPNSNLHIQQLDNHLPSSNDSVNCNYTSPQMNDQDVTGVLAEQTYKENFHCTDKMQQRHLDLHGIGDQQPCLSGKCRTLHLTLSQYQQHVQTPCDVYAPNPCTSVKPATKPTQLQVPSGPVSLLEKRKSLTLSLTPLGMNPSLPASNRSQPVAVKDVHNSETGGCPGVQRDTDSYRQKGAELHREQTPTHSKCSRAQVKEQGPVSPFTFTLNKLLDWGERLLFRGVFVHPVRMGQPALPYKC